MELIRTLRHGRFTIHAHGRALPDGQWTPHYVIIEHLQSGDVELRHFVCPPCVDELTAAGDAMEAAFEWIDSRYQEF